VLRGLREGVVTTRWPASADAYADGWRGPVVVAVADADADARVDDAAGLAEICPTGAIGLGPRQEPRLDTGRCVLCGRCVRERPDVFAWSSGIAAASLSRPGLVVPVPDLPETEENLAALRDALAVRTSALRRSVHLRHVDAGSDGSEEQEIAALLNPVYDIGRLGLFFTATPRHADVLLVTGAGAHGMAEPLRLTYEGMPDPKVVIAVGTDAVSGGMLGADGYATSGGVGEVVPVDVWLPGSPPPPFAILQALLLGLGRLPGSGRGAGSRGAGSRGAGARRAGSRGAGSPAVKGGRS
jgi:Ni,Fe-hydrogenase III small subunit/ferredoxin